MFHLAAQVAVTTSLADPMDDFERNALGTLNLLEELATPRQSPPPLVFTSTNKVYGGLEDVSLDQAGTGATSRRIRFVRMSGIGESRPLDFHSPYGCSKGAADQYVIDYARTFELPAVVFRMSCIYGPHQCGNEDQGWVAHFLIQALAGRTLSPSSATAGRCATCFTWQTLWMPSDWPWTTWTEVKGKAFNMGGGPENTISLLEFLGTIEALHGRKPEVAFGEWRPGDQRYYVSDTSRFNAATGWTPRFSARQGIEALDGWLGGARPAEVAA